MRSMGLFPEGAKVNHYLTDTDAWFVRTNAPNGLKLFQRDRAPSSLRTTTSTPRT
jgi:hypothetical protein